MTFTGAKVIIISEKTVTTRGNDKGLSKRTGTKWLISSTKSLLVLRISQLFFCKSERGFEMSFEGRVNTCLDVQECVFYPIMRLS